MSGTGRWEHQEQDNKSVESLTWEHLYFLPSSKQWPWHLKGKWSQIDDKFPNPFLFPPTALPHFTSLYLSLLSFGLIFQNKSFVILKEGKPMPEQGFPDQRVLCMQHGGRTLSGGLASRWSPAGGSARGKHLSSCVMLSLSPRQLREFLTHME